MKPKQVALLSFLLPFLAFLTNLPLAFSDNVYPVLDVMDNPLETDSHFYILPANRENGGLKLAKTGKSNCPLTILQDKSEEFEGMPIKFITPGDSPFVETGTKLDIEFVNKPGCAKSGKWALFSNEEDVLPYVGIGGEFQDPDGKFRIQESKAGYRLMFCVNSGSQSCWYIGMSDVKNNEDGRRLTTDNQSPYDIVFEVASEDNKIIKSQNGIHNTEKNNGDEMTERDLTRAWKCGSDERNSKCRATAQCQSIQKNGCLAMKIGVERFEAKLLLDIHN
ncbi:hypothetical protein V8G54_012122 [Vigna mungo]|uniref:Uncharacterized protein n=1 Tax=Vigna mungo TaxID=3915 RepID=A0AAQ3NT62_VIGMU